MESFTRGGGTPSSSIDSTSTDRRSLLKKAALAGGVAWVAPTVLASPAGAACGTPKCAYPDFTQTVLQIRAFDLCDPGVSGDYVGAGVGANTTKAAEFEITLASAFGSCTCGTPTQQGQVLVGAVSASWDKVQSCSTAYSQHQIDAVNNPIRPNRFLLYKGGGALGSGVYIPEGSMCISVGCKDSRGVTVYKSCSFKICINYSPAQACGFISTVNASWVLVPGSCTTGCTPC